MHWFKEIQFYQVCLKIRKKNSFSSQQIYHWTKNSVLTINYYDNYFLL